MFTDPKALQILKEEQAANDAFFAEMDAKILEATRASLEMANNSVKFLKAQNTELLEALKAITERAEAVSEGITVEKRNPGVSQATHVAHMASHLAQHAKHARAAIQKAGG